MIIEKIKKHFEKVKLGLECCTERYSRCRECPYDQNKYGLYSNSCERYLREDLVELFNLIDF